MARRTQFQLQRMAYILILVAMSLFVIFPFIVPIVFAGTVALALYPLQIKLEKRNWKKGRAAALITTIFTFVISIPFMFFVTKGSIMVIETLEKFSISDRVHDQGMQQVVKNMRTQLVDITQTYLSKLPFAEMVTEEKINTAIKSVNVVLLSFFKNMATNIPTIVLFLVVMILCTYAFLHGAGGVRSFFQDLFGFNRRKMDHFVSIFLRDARQVYISNIATGSVQSLIVATGVYFVTGADWFLVFFVTLIFSFVPVIGAAPMAGVFAIVSFFQDNITGSIILVVLGVFTGLIDNILRPWLASFGESKAPGVVNFIFVIGGALWIGFPGLFIGLLMGNIVYDTLPLFWEEIEKTEAPASAKNFSGFFSLGGKTGPDEKSKH